MVRLLGQDGVQALARGVVALGLDILLRFGQQLALALLAFERAQAAVGPLVLRIDFQHTHEGSARQIALPRLRLALGLLQAAAGRPFARLQIGAAVLRIARVLLQRFLQLLQAGRHLVLRDQLAPVAVGLLPCAAGQQHQQ
ncbi:hypothetical protein D3C81_1582200 [compost metagenome]